MTMSLYQPEQPATVRKWTSTAGPRQTKAVNESLGALRWRGKGRIEVTDHGENFVVGMCAAPSASCVSALEEIGERYAYTITRDNYRAIVADCEAATKALPVPKEDLRTTPEQRAALAAAMSEDNDRHAKHAEACRLSIAAIIAKKPTWADALIVAIHDEDDSDPMSDYHNHTSDRHVAIGWRKGKREDFRQLREAASCFPDTAHLGPGCDSWTVTAYTQPDEGPHKFRERRNLQDPESYRPMRFLTEAAACEYVSGLLATSREEIDDSDLRGFRCDAERYGVELHVDKVEHRENYSMGAGNYLKFGSRDSTGWCVKSVEVECLAGYGHTLEDGFPVKTATPAAMNPNVSECNGCEIQKHYHEKYRFDFWLIVPSSRLESADFDRIRDACKAANGWYSRQWGRTPGGFAFKMESDAQAFAVRHFGTVPGEDATSPADAEESTPVAQVQPAVNPIPAKFRDMAERIQTDIDHKRNPNRLENTPKRMREGASARIDADHLERVRLALLRLADAHEAGTVPPSLANLRTKAEIVPMLRTRTGSTGYYDIHDTSEFSDTSATAKALQAFIGDAKDADQQKADAVRELENRVKFCDIPGFFPTPAAVIAEMLEAAEIEPGMVILEPSAGKGDILDAVRERFADSVVVLAVEVSPTLADICRAKGHGCECADFLTWEATRIKPDVVLMNPPFERGADAEHVRHAYAQLRPGGRLVAIMSAGTFQRTTGNAKEWQEFADEVNADVRDLPAGAFSGRDAFRQTGVSAKMVVICKPAVVETTQGNYIGDVSQEIEATAWL